MVRVIQTLGIYLCQDGHIQHIDSQLRHVIKWTTLSALMVIFYILDRTESMSKLVYSDVLKV